MWRNIGKMRKYYWNDHERLRTNTPITLNRSYTESAACLHRGRGVHQLFVLVRLVGRACSVRRVAHPDRRRDDHAFGHNVGQPRAHRRTRVQRAAPRTKEPTRTGGEPRVVGLLLATSSAGQPKPQRDFNAAARAVVLPAEL